MGGIACFERASPALKEILLNIYHAEKPMELDHHLHEFGSVKYHIKASASEPYIAYLSISTPVLSSRFSPPPGLPHFTKETINGTCSRVLDIVDPAREGYQLTLRLDMAKIPPGKESMKMITEISSVQSVILSSQLKKIFTNVTSQDATQGMYRPVKLVYHPREPFYVIKKPNKVTAVFPMRFKEDTDMIIARTFFEELVVVQSSGKWVKTPPCTWSPIPPPELRGESFQDLTTNGGFVTFDIFSRHVKGKKLDKTVWSLLNLYALVKYHIQCTRGFIQRRMRNRLDNLAKLLRNTSIEEDQHVKVQEIGCLGNIVGLTKSRTRREVNSLKNKAKRIKWRIKIISFNRFRRLRWLKIPKFTCVKGYKRLVPSGTSHKIGTNRKSSTRIMGSML